MFHRQIRFMQVMIPIHHHVAGLILMEMGISRPLPADFFGLGSDPFEGTVSLEGANSEGSQLPLADMIIRRLGDLSFSAPYPPTGTIEIVQLNLKSTEPITVTDAAGVDSFFDVFVELSIEATSDGTSDITQPDDYGGEFGYDVLVNYLITIVNQATNNPVVFDPVALGISPVQFTSTSDLWTRSPLEDKSDVVGDERDVFQSVAGTTIQLLLFIV